MKTQYRPDIDGLRAIAVLAVVGYHAFPNWSPGGFVGVDVFFVISGFLISGIILRELDEGTFGYLKFYRRRVARIFPALIIVLTATLIAGWFLLLPDMFRELGISVIAGAGSFANVLFWQQSGYFDDAWRKPLLHLWSLGVEEQFYLVWPLLLATLHKSGRRVFPAICAVVAASFLWNVATIQSHQSAAFFLPMARMWELGLGALLACVMRRGQSYPHAVSPLGLLLIGASIAVMRPYFLFPGWWAIAPCVGAACVIAAPGSELNRLLLSNPVMVWIGRISYPLYLWHWVLLCLPNLDSDGDGNSRAHRISAVLLSVVLAWLTHELLEKKVKTRRFAILRPAALVGFMGVVSTAAALEIATDGGAFRYPPSVRQLATLQIAAETRFYEQEWRVHRCFLITPESFKDFGDDCIEREPQSARLVVLWGDSHAASLYDGLRAMQKDVGGFRIAEFTKGLCPPVLGLEIDKELKCKGSNDAVFGRIKSLQPDTVIVAGNWSNPDYSKHAHYLDAGDKLRDTIEALRNLGIKHVVVFGSLPHWTEHQPRVELLLWKELGKVPDRTTRDIDATAAVADRQVRTAVANTGATFVSPLDLLCNAEGCLLDVDHQTAVPVTWDNHHLSDAGSTLLVRLSSKFIGLAPAPAP